MVFAAADAFFRGLYFFICKQLATGPNSAYAVFLIQLALVGRSFIYGAMITPLGCILSLICAWRQVVETAQSLGAKKRSTNWVALALGAAYCFSIVAVFVLFYGGVNAQLVAAVAASSVLIYMMLVSFGRACARE